MTFHNRLKDMREDHDLTQTQAGKIIGTSQSDYGKYERGQMMMGIDKYIALAKYYNVSLDYLCGILDTPEPLWRGSKPPKITPRPSEDEKLLEAYHRAGKNVQNGIKQILGL